MLEFLTELARSPNHPLGLFVLLASSAVEYLFPPFPGDTVTLFGAVLITTYHWSFWWIVGLTTLGSLLGAAGDFGLGVLARRRAHRPNTPRKAVTASRIDMLGEKFKKHGELYILVNRFLPGIRALFFYAAGYSGMRLSRVLLYAGLSALVWNLLLVALGASLGANFEELSGIVTRYTEVVWAILVALALFFGGRALWRRRRAAKEPPAPPPARE